MARDGFIYHSAHTLNNASSDVEVGELRRLCAISNTLRPIHARLRMARVAMAWPAFDRGLSKAAGHCKMTA